MIIDIHTHIYPPHMTTRILDAVRERAGVHSYTDGTLKGLLRSMEGAKIDCSVVSRIATQPDQVEPINQWLQGIRHPQIFLLATMHPDLPITADFISSLKTKGFKGFKVHPDYQDFFVDERRAYPLYELAQAGGMPVLFHVGVDPGLPTPVHASPKRLAQVHSDFPRLRIIAAHMGGADMYQEVERYLLGRDIYLDTSFVLRKMPAPLLKRFFARHPIERFLFGTDSPWLDQGEELRFLLSLPFLTDDAKEKIVGTNTARLLGLVGTAQKQQKRVDG
jgi:predicted TIM-barrel fold metal-dependent hydrolase